MNARPSPAYDAGKQADALWTLRWLHWPVLTGVLAFLLAVIVGA